MDASKLINSLANRFGLNGMEPEPEGHFEFHFDGKLILNILAEGRNRLLLFSPICRIPQDDAHAAEQKVKKMMKMNLGKLADSHEMLAYEEESHEMVIYRRLETAGLTVDNFEEIVETYLNNLEFWMATPTQEATSFQRPPMNMFFP
ncbi:CesT family type III secretion system chaperone [Acanthopleuribacter pedis]|uniref:Type III secretion system chaperone n=1 Tax=Acanthopleuribacter pedis TaxID=442870 RepID=A0A8J7QQZ6_9BACT|nr:CesT family type III secretion system chaperone [Acanthopleuribacter pedis]MBO1322585.1 type III secretion system chaperone [Acanthopleuribacter pedis]